MCVCMCVCICMCVFKNNQLQKEKVVFAFSFFFVRGYTEKCGVEHLGGDWGVAVPHYFNLTLKTISQPSALLFSSMHKICYEPMKNQIIFGVL